MNYKIENSPSLNKIDMHAASKEKLKMFFTNFFLPYFYFKILLD